MRFTRLKPRFNIIKRQFCHHNNISEQIPKNVNIVSRLNDIDDKLNDIDIKVKNMDSIMFSIFCLWNGVYFPVILYFSN
jgi:hypothetical protein